MYLLTIVLVLALFVLDMSLLILNYRQRAQPIPANVADVYNQEDYAQWLHYTMEKFKLSLISKSVNTAILLFMLSFNLFPQLGKTASTLTANVIIETLIFLAMYGAIYYVSNLGFSMYQTFVIEAKYGFNTTTVKTYVTDQIKSMFLGLLLGGSVLSLLLYLYITLGKGAIIYAWIIIMSIVLIMNLLYTRLFIRLFNKLTPLPEGELKDKSKLLAHNLGYELKKISVMDASKRSTRINAFFTGFGRFKSIILYDTLIQKCSTDEIVSVLAHEIGHSKNRDVFKNLLLTAFQMAIYLSILAYFLSSTYLSNAFGFTTHHYGFALVLFGILMESIGIIVSMPLSALSRKAEYRADACAADAGYGHALSNALKVLARENFANLTPHPLVVKLTYSHPTVSQRLKALSAKKVKD